MHIRRGHWWVSAAVAVVVAQFVGAAMAVQGPTTAATPPQGSRGGAPQNGRATGTLTVGAAKIPLAYAYAFPEKDGADPAKENYRIFLTNRPLPPAAIKLATTAGADEGDRQQLVVEMSDQKIQGVEAIIAADKRVLRVNVYSPDSILGLMLIGPSQFQDTAFDAKRIAGRLSFEKQPDSRINKPIHYDATFAAVPHRPAGY